MKVNPSSVMRRGRSGCSGGWRLLVAGDEVAVGGFGLEGVVTLSAVARGSAPDARDQCRLSAVLSGSAVGELDPADLASDEHAPGVGVVLLAGEQVPGDDREVAGDRDRGDL